MSAGRKYGKNRPYDVIVCGAGHAGCEAASAAARVGGATAVRRPPLLDGKGIQKSIFPLKSKKK